ncbi:TPA: hypothetical protein EYP70_07680 [Candidatus Bathyarchaeota archaeon]|nr:hypothetical protein [Candidatus Bathyarchaeota archaeon]
MIVEIDEEIGPVEIVLVDILVHDLKRLGCLNCLNCGSPLDPMLRFILLKASKDRTLLGAYVECLFCGEKNSVDELIKKADLVVEVLEADDLEGIS